MNYRKLLLLLCITYILSNCSSDDNPKENETTEIYYTFKAYLYDSSEIDNWIIIHNENGELLDYKQYESGDNFIFEGPSSLITGKISVTFLDHFEAADSYYHNIKTYPEVEKGSVKDQNPTNSSDEDTTGNSKIGDFTLTLNNCPELEYIEVFNENGGAVQSGGGTGKDGLWTYTYNLSLFEKNDYLISTLNNDMDYRYYEINNVIENDNISIDYSDFNSFENIVNVDLPEYNGFDLLVRAFEDHQQMDFGEGYGLILASEISFPISNLTSLKVGYLDRFSKYETRLLLNMDGYDYAFIKKGTQPNQIIIPEKPTLIIENESIYDFKFSTEVSYIKSSSRWEYEVGVENVDLRRTRWTIYPELKKNSKIGQIPEEIQLKYPEMNINNLKYKQTSLSLNDEESVTIYK